MTLVLQIAAGVALGTLLVEAANLLAARAMLGWMMKRADRWLAEADAKGKAKIAVRKPARTGGPRGFWH